jgi:hypothetical protein
VPLAEANRGGAERGHVMEIEGGGRVHGKGRGRRSTARV